MEIDCLAHEPNFTVIFKTTSIQSVLWLCENQELTEFPVIPLFVNEYLPLYHYVL